MLQHKIVDWGRIDRPHGPFVIFSDILIKMCFIWNVYPQIDVLCKKKTIIDQANDANMEQWHICDAHYNFVCDVCVPRSDELYLKFLCISTCIYYLFFFHFWPYVWLIKRYQMFISFNKLFSVNYLNFYYHPFWSQTLQIYAWIVFAV